MNYMLRQESLAKFAVYVRRRISPCVRQQMAIEATLENAGMDQERVVL
jgi:hypothetical protein